jgi:hypothetical protein
VIILAKKIKHLHTNILFLAALLIASTLIFRSIKNSQAEPNNLQSNKEVAKKECDSSGSPVINVTQKVLNTVDSGEGGNYWAFDNLSRQIKVYKQSDNTFCALVDYEGQFDSQPGQQSPGNTGKLTGKEDGTFKGGYRATIIGAMKENPDFSTKGNIGTVDYRCEINGICPGAFNWVDIYFTEPIFSYEWWGWEYKYKNLKWVNSSDGNSGDII